MALPFGGMALAKTSYGATMWAYRNPVAIGDFIIGFGNKNYWNVTNKHQNMGATTRRIFEELAR